MMVRARCSIFFMAAQPRPTAPYERTDGAPATAYLGVHDQTQDGLKRVGINVPVGRLSVAEVGAKRARWWHGGLCRGSLVVRNRKDDLSSLGSHII